MLTTLVIVIVALISFVAGRASAPALPKRDKRGRFIRRKKREPLRLPTLPSALELGPQHLAVVGAACLGIGLALAVPPVLAPFTALAPLPLGVAWGVRIITPKKSNQSWAHLPLSAGWDPTDIMWEEWRND